MGLGFQLDIFNNTSRHITVSSGPSSSMNSGSFPTADLNGGQWMSSLNNNQPFYLEVDGDTGSVTINVVASAGSSLPPSGSFILEFDTTSLNNFNGIPLFGSSGDFSPVPTAGNQGGSFIFPVLYLDVWSQWTQAIVMFVEATHSTSNIQRPY